MDVAILIPLQPSFMEWLLKTRMSFYGHDLALPWWFGGGCWNFALGGLIMMWTTEPQWMAKTRFPWKTVACLLIFVQSPLSFLADYVYMEKDSYWHVVDRCLALPLMATEVYKYGLMCQHSLMPCVRWFCDHVKWNSQQIAKQTSTSSQQPAMHPLLIVLYGVAIVLAIAAFLQSTKAQSNLDRDAFVYWHTVWHLYPLVVSSIVLFDFYACHGWKQSTRKYIYAAELLLIRQNNSSSRSHSDTMAVKPWMHQVFVKSKQLQQTKAVAFAVKQ